MNKQILKKAFQLVLIIALLVASYFTGYKVGYQKSNNKWYDNFKKQRQSIDSLNARVDSLKIKWNKFKNNE